MEIFAALQLKKSNILTPPLESFLSYFCNFAWGTKKSLFGIKVLQKNCSQGFFSDFNKVFSCLQAGTIWFIYVLSTLIKQMFYSMLLKCIKSPWAYKSGYVLHTDWGAIHIPVYIHTACNTNVVFDARKIIGEYVYTMDYVGETVKSRFTYFFTASLITFS